MLIVNQSSMDGLCGIFLILQTIYDNSANRTMQPGAVADEALCRLWYSRMPMFGMLYSSLYCIVAMTFERYIAIVHPIWHRSKFTRAKLGLLLSLAWLSGPVFQLPYSILTSGITETGQCSILSLFPTRADMIILAVFIFAYKYVFPLTLIIIFYVKILLVLRRNVPLQNNNRSTAVQNTID